MKLHHLRMAFLVICFLVCSQGRSQQIAYVETGDGIQFGPIETCDDGNITDGDGCSASCTAEAEAAVDFVPLPGFSSRILNFENRVRPGEPRFDFTLAGININVGFSDVAFETGFVIGAEVALGNVELRFTKSLPAPMDCASCAFNCDGVNDQCMISETADVCDVDEDDPDVLRFPTASNSVKQFLTLRNLPACEAGLLVGDRCEWTNDCPGGSLSLNNCPPWAFDVYRVVECTPGGSVSSFPATMVAIETAPLSGVVDEDSVNIVWSLRDEDVSGLVGPGGSTTVDVIVGGSVRQSLVLECSGCDSNTAPERVVCVSGSCLQTNADGIACTGSYPCDPPGPISDTINNNTGTITNNTDPAVPEPTTISLLIMSLLLLAGRRWR